MFRLNPFLIALALFALALAVRLPGLDTFFTADEFLWVERSHDFLGGLLSPEYPCLLPSETQTNAVPGQGLACTLRTGHPGVLTMWTGAGGIILQWLTDPVARQESLLTFVQNLPYNPVERKTITPVRLPTVIITSLFVAAFYLLLRKLFKEPVPLIAALLLALNPFHIALSRVLHHDALSTSFIISASLCLMIYFGLHHKRGWLLLAGLLSGVAMLSKSTGFFLIPYAGLLALWSMAARWARDDAPFAKALGRTVVDGLLWAGMAALAFFVFWPAMWVIPGWALNTIYSIGFKYASGGHAKGVFFFNTILKDPGPLFYPVMWFFRTNFWALLGAIIALMAGMWALPRRFTPVRGAGNPALPPLRGELEGGKTLPMHLKRLINALSPAGFDDKFGIFIWVSAFLFFFLIAMTLGEKKQDRYVLPIYPMLDLIAAGGLWYVVRQRKMAVQYSLIGLIFALNLLTVLRYSPYYFTYYNPLAGGAKAAAASVTIGWGDGLDKAADYLNQKPNAQTLKVSSWYGSTFAPYFEGETIRYSDQKGAALAGDYIVFYVNQQQRHFPDDEIWRYFEENYGLETSIPLNGVDYAWIFPGRGIGHYVEDQTYKGIGALLGWDWTGKLSPDDGPIAAGESLPLSIFWEYLGKVPEERFFARLIGPDGNIWAETITQPMPQFAETSLWRKGQIIEEGGLLTIPADTPPGDYALQIGFETNAPAIPSGELTFPTANAPLDGPLQTITVSPGPVQDISAGQNLAELVLLNPTPEIKVNDSLNFDLRWAITASTAENYEAAFALLDESGQTRWLWDYQPLIDFLPTSQWPENTPLRSQWRLPLDDPRTPGGAFSLVLMLSNGNGQPVTHSLGTVQLEGRVRDFALPADIPPLNAQLGEALALAGYSLDTDTLNPAQPLNLTLYWQSLAPVDEDYTVFVQLLGPDGQVYAQQDSQPAGGTIPTSSWTPGEIVSDAYTLTLPADLPPGSYRLITGMYQFETGERLPVTQGDESRDFVLLWTGANGE